MFFQHAGYSSVLIKQIMNNIFCAAKPFLNFLNICGLFTSSFDGHPRKGRFVFTSCGGLMSLLNFTFLLISPFLPFNLNRSSVLSSDILSTAWEILSNSEVLTYTLSLAYQLSRQTSIKQFITSVNKFDNQV